MLTDVLTRVKTLVGESALLRNRNTVRLVIAALLCAVGIVIPMFSPLKLVLEPASFTLGSHVAIFIAMFISPVVAVVVSLGTSLGFFLGGFPLVIVLRAVTHVVFSLVGAFILKKYPNILHTVRKSTILSFGLGLLHAVCEVAVVAIFFFGSNMSEAYYAKGFVTSVIGLVGIGTVVHSMVDFGIAYAIWKALTRSKNSGLRLISDKP